MNTDNTNNVLDKPMTSQEKKESLKIALQAKINASKIDRMSKLAKQGKMIKIQKQVQKELGNDYDLNKLMSQISNQK
jgi:hypothetical protein